MAFVPALDQRGTFGREALGAQPLVAIPFNRSTPIAFTNGAHARRGERRPSATWEELVDVAQRAHAPRAQRRGALGLRGAHLVVVLGRDGGAGRRPPRRARRSRVARRRGRRGGHPLLAAPGADERVMRPPPGRDYQAWQSSNESFLQGRIAMMWSSTAYVRYLEDNARFPVVAAPLPAATCAPAYPRAARCSCCMRVRARRGEAGGAGTSSAGCARPSRRSRGPRAPGTCPSRAPRSSGSSSEGWYAQHPNDRVAYDQLAAVEPWPWAPDLFRVERDVVEPRLEDAVLTGKRRRACCSTRRATKRRGPREAALALAPVGDAGPDARAARRLLRPAHRRRRLREPLLVGPAHAAALRRHRQLSRAGGARRAAARRAAHARLQRARRERHHGARPGPGSPARPARAASSRSCARASSAPTSSAGWRWRCSGCGSSTATRAWSASCCARSGRRPWRCSATPLGAAGARARGHLEAHRLRDDRLPRGPAGRAALAARGGGARRRRRVEPLPPRDAAAAGAHRVVRRHDQPGHELPGVRRRAHHDAGRPGARHGALRLRHLRADLPRPLRRPRQRADRGVLRALARGRPRCSCGRSGRGEPSDEGAPRRRRVLLLALARGGRGVARARTRGWSSRRSRRCPRSSPTPPRRCPSTWTPARTARSSRRCPSPATWASHLHGRGHRQRCRSCSRCPPATRSPSCASWASASPSPSCSRACSCPRRRRSSPCF